MCVSTEHIFVLFLKRFSKLLLVSQNGRRCRTRTAIPAPKAGVLPLHYILYMVEPAGIEPASEIPTWTRPSYAIDDFPVMLYSGHLRYRQILPRAYIGLHTSTTLFLIGTRKTTYSQIFNRRHLPGCWCVILESSRQSGGNTLRHKSGKHRVDHHNSFRVVISFLF